MEFKYLERIHELMDVIEKDETKSMEECVDLLTTCILNKHSIYTFGASHAGILSE